MEQQYRTAVSFAFTTVVKTLVDEYDLPREALTIALEAFKEGMGKGMTLTKEEARELARMF